MTETEWLACAEPASMLAYLRRHSSDRKLRLFACAWYRRGAIPWAVEGKAQWALQVGERYADGLSDEAERADAHEWAQLAVESAVMDQNFDLAANLAEVRQCCGPRGSELPWGGSVTATNPTACAVIREIFSYPFRLLAFDPAWQTSDVLLLARGIYDERAFDRMPILADALQDAGCDSDDNPLPPRGGNLLSHLRDANATHVRGCWALDLVLGKE